MAKKSETKSSGKGPVEKLLRTTVIVRHNFSPKELAEKAQQLGEAVKDMAQIEEERAGVMSEYKEQIIKKNSEIKVLSDHITQKYEMRNTECFLRKDFKLKERQYLTHDGVVLKTEPLTTADYQLHIGEQGAAPKKTKGPQAKKKKPASSKKSNSKKPKK